GSCARVRARFADVVLIETGENLGFAEACNRGIARATGEWIVTLNNDAVAAPDFIAELRAVASACASHVGSIQARIVFRGRERTLNSTGIALFADGTAMDRDYEAPVRDGDVVEEIFCATAGAAMYRRAMLDAIALPSGAFDRGFFMYCEDLDLGWRAQLAGWSCLYAPRATVAHVFQASSKRHGTDFVALQCKKNRLRTLVKNGSRRMIARGLVRSVLDVGYCVRRGGSAAIGELARGIESALDERRRVQQMTTRPRAEIERRWIVR
ncbi:MAG: glycosyltransferase, partial [Polyangiales bacterium]